MSDVSLIEKAYVRGLKEGRAQQKRKLDEKRAAYNELVIRYKTAVGEGRRLKNLLGKSAHNNEGSGSR